MTTNFHQRALAAHNRERAAMGIPPLAWDNKLQASAQTWADRLIATGRFEHAPEDASHPEGENIWMGTKRYYSAEAMIDAWAREKRFYKPGLFPNNSLTGKVADVSHYTQLLWRQSAAVGCAVATGARDDILVCRYSDAGNYIGERPF